MKKNEELSSEAIRLRSEGMTYTAIGIKLGISKQRVGQILKQKAMKKCELPGCENICQNWQTRFCCADHRRQWGKLNRGLAIAPGFACGQENIESQSPKSQRSHEEMEQELFARMTEARALYLKYRREAEAWASIGAATPGTPDGSLAVQRFGRSTTAARGALLEYEAAIKAFAHFILDGKLADDQR